ncbi:MAG: hypothetical protein EBS65_04210 [Betaproteobacteria bacterium]|nr:hypothetical protein [Betaproteobacteria bacterium]
MQILSMLRILRTTALGALFALAFAPLANAAGVCSGVLDRTMTAIDDQSRSLCDYAGKVVLIVNTARSPARGPVAAGSPPIRTLPRNPP